MSKDTIDRVAKDFGLREQANDQVSSVIEIEEVPGMYQYAFPFQQRYHQLLLAPLGSDAQDAVPAPPRL